MKTLSLLAIALSTTLTFALSQPHAFASANDIPTQYSLLPSKIFVPMGFDDNDNAQIVVDGTLKNACEHKTNTEVKVEPGKITVKVNAFYTTGVMCIDVITPYFETLDIGVLDEGKYKVVAIVSDQEIEMNTLSVVNAKSKNPDNHLYAPVSEVHLGMFNTNGILVLSGSYTSSCMKISDVQYYVANEVLTVLPIIVKTSDSCATVMKDYIYTTPVSIRLPEGRFLVHVRTMHGQSLNHVMSVSTE